MTFVQSKGFLYAAGLAVIMHLFLFTAIRPKTGRELTGMLVPPATSYRVRAPSSLSMSEHDVRTIWSPVIFSLPSHMGFSRELTEQDVRTRLTFSQQMESERFLVVDPMAHHGATTMEPQQLMVSAAQTSTPGLPVDIFQALEKRPAARRVNLAPELKERLLGGVVLPSELNQETASPWEVHASVSVSEQGMVEHVFLDHPLESLPLNQQLLQLLYGLRFKSGEMVEGSVEIYSPETASNGEVSP